MQRSTMPDNKVASQILSSADAISSLMDQHGISDSNDEVDVSELLTRLERADGMAKGVEGRLDEILEDLDRLLESVGTQNPVPPRFVASKVVKT
jgi:hypothetical protein